MKVLQKLKHVQSLFEGSTLCRQFSIQCILQQTIAEQRTKKVVNATELPGPLQFPLLQNVLYVILHKDFERKKIYRMFSAMQKEFGPTYKLHMHGLEPVVFFTNPEDIQEMYAVTSSNPIRVGLASLKKIRKNAEGNLFGNKSGILPENNEEWKRVRSKVQGPFLKLQNVRTYLSSMDEVSIDFVNSLPRMLDNKSETPQDFLLELYKWALESIGAVSLNTRLGCLAQHLPQDSEQLKLIGAVNTLLENLFKAEFVHIWKIYQNKTYRDLAKAHHFIQRVTEKNIKLAEEEISKNGRTQSQPILLEALLKTESLSRSDVVTMILDMFIGGIDTTSHAVAFALYLLSRNKKSQGLLQKEIDGIFGNEERPIVESDLAKFTYLKACMKETLRLYPIVTGVFRQFETEVVINNLRIPKGWHGMFSNLIMGRDESLFTRATEFHPERWLKDKPLGIFHPYASLPFSHGSRNCIGRRIAEQEILVLLARIFHKYDVEYHYGEMEYNEHLVLIPASPLTFQFTQRK